MGSGVSDWASEAASPPPEADELAEEIAAVERAQKGDRRAFARLYRAFGPMVHGILLSRVEDRDVADLVQEVFMTVMRRLPELREPKSFGSWLASIARNRAVDHARRRRPTEELPDTPAEEASLAKQAEAREVLRTIRTLPASYRETLVLRLVEGMTGPEIAMRTGLTAGSVRVNLHRGMKLLREKLLRGGGDE
jgi:RNA polymerase sigma-70 factor (ECF subfamily)